MPDSTITALPAVGLMDGTELYYGVRAGQDFKVSGKKLAASDIVNVDNFYPPNAGAVHNDASHTLDNYFATLAAAQAFYPFVTSLSQQVDYCACKLASNTAFGADGFENAANISANKRLRIPAGSYVFGNDTWLIRNLASGIIEGDGKLATTLKGNNSVLAFDGLWYSEISNMSILAQTTSAVAALDMDGNVPGHPYATRGVQGNTLRNLLIDGGGSQNAFAMCRQGGSSGQGSECLFLNLHMSSASFACYYQNGYNALNNTFVGGNCQGYPQNGIYVVGGTAQIISMGFQSTTGYKQMENSGWDIYMGEAGVYSGVIVYGCRTESLRFLKNAGAVSIDIRCCSQDCAMQGWSANTAFGPAAAAYKAIIEGGLLYVATTPGTTGSTKPTFPLFGTVNDGTVVWTQTDCNMIENGAGSVDRRSLRVTAGNVFSNTGLQIRTINANTIMDWSDDVIICDCTSGPIEVQTPPLVPDVGGGANRGRQITIRKSDTSANAVTIRGWQNSYYIEDAITMTLAGGARHAVTLMWADQLYGANRRWVVLSQF